ncbi:MAG: hypothetical protein K2L03_06990 [Bacteroidales bacterium]|nr:hypothetical protein [Bacteroidales bacterium]MDE7102915.1 hypothetical protein [Bacteroidales bacterium]
MKRMYVQTGLMGVALAALMTLTSCKIVRTADYNKLIEDNLMMTESIFRSDSIQNCFMSAYAEIERNIDEIKVREKMIVQANEEGPIDQQQKILNDIAEIGKLMESNRKQLRQMQSLRKQLIESKKQTARLQERSAQLQDQNTRLQEENRQLRESSKVPTPQPAVAPAPATNNQSEKLAYYERENQRLAELNKQLEEQIAGLKNKVTESEARIESLQEELALLKDAYAALQAINDSLQIEIVRYQKEIETKDSQLASKDNEIATLNGMVSTAYYFVGTAKDIKEKSILDKKTINPNVKITNFTRIENYNDERTIETKSAKVVLMSTHPSGSYTINNKNPKNVVIEIKDPAKFWSITRFCIIQKK